MRGGNALAVILLLSAPACRPQTGRSTAAAVVTPDSDAGEGGHLSTDGGYVRTWSHPPQNHRPSAQACSTVRSSEVPDGGVTGTSGGCTTDDDCDAGDLGRCVLVTAADLWTCSYDTCTSDADCGDAGVCECANATVTGSPNTCLTTGNCQVDSDCGPGGYCSPDIGGCAPYVGTLGYFCHTSDDECLDTSDCSSIYLYCAYMPTLNRWTCIPPPDCTG